MIGAILVTLRKGEPSDESQLREIAPSICANEVRLDQRQDTEDTQRYIGGLTRVYSCVSRNVPWASFLWLDAQEFEIVVETSHQGHVLHSVEGIAGRLWRLLAQLGIRADIVARLQTVSDAQVYVVGHPSPPMKHVWSG